MRNLLPPVVLIFAVLGSILAGAATPTEAAGVGAFGATVLAAIKGQLSIARLREVVQSTTEVTSMVFLILIGAAVFSLVFRGFGGEELVEQFFAGLPGGVVAATLLVMLVIFFAWLLFLILLKSPLWWCLSLPQCFWRWVWILFGWV